MPDFNIMSPPQSVTNPQQLPVGHFPRHLHKPGAFLLVENEEEQAAGLADGWLERPPAPKAPKK